MHLFERTIGNGMGEQILRAFEQVDVFLRSGELYLVTLDPRQSRRVLDSFGRSNSCIAPQLARRAGAVCPILRSVSSGKFANRRPEGFDEAPPAGRPGHGYANEFGTERLDAVGDGRLWSESADNAQNLALGAVFGEG